MKNFQQNATRKLPIFQLKLTSFFISIDWVYLICNAAVKFCAETKAICLSKIWFCNFSGQQVLIAETYPCLIAKFVQFSPFRDYSKTGIEKGKPWFCQFQRQSFDNFVWLAPFSQMVLEIGWQFQLTNKAFTREISMKLIGFSLT